ncbi:MAG: bifunctional phosphoribosylaminoimidazolecarboxamide formyltransferase/inosine monophosphate cyclohydrolase [Solibacterales bacterium]|nr:bifunctional phosphoribosylaminoimidazolecarboxamide formyltransferase/inosine monophosphate cyclohydrolase [Bryobacterales bacterium]|tara:strand:+ start:186 stop:1730 length:1545 start_codon:yes stop_codon:yes gene_type:complete
MHRALLSVTDKTGIVEFAQKLIAHDIELVSTGGTAHLLRSANLVVRDVAELTGFPEMLDGRIKTLHPKVAGGILAIRSNSDHMAAINEQSISLIDMVVVNLYAFEKTANREGVSFDEIIENIDIGGPTMIRAAAKNFRDVAVVTDPADYARIAAELDDGNGVLPASTHWYLAQRAFALTAAYDRAINRKLQCIPSPGARDSVSVEKLPNALDINIPKKLELRYGENPHQSAALYASNGGGLGSAKKLHGKDLSFNNLVDLDAAWQLIQEFKNPAAAIIKHTNPCGCAEQESAAEAFRRALECDPVSAFGSVLAFNCKLDTEAAEEISALFVEAIVAPGYSREALEILTKKRDLRLLEIGVEPTGPAIKSISGGFLVQSQDDLSWVDSQLTIATERSPSEDEMKALLFGWKVVKHVKSNAIVYVRGGQTVGVGAGQMSRVDAARIGASKAVLSLENTVASSDAFFPFADGVDEIAGHGVTAIIQPGGSKRDQEVIDAANKHGLAMVLTGIRHFRH